MVESRRDAVVVLMSILAVAFGACGESHGSTDAGSRGDSSSRDAGATDGGATDGGATDGGAGWAACAGPEDCVVVSVSCCGRCGQPTPGDMVAVHVDHVRDYRDGGCDGVGCPACYMEPDAHLVATCDAGRCLAVDLRAEPLTECMADTDCVLRAPACCACSMLDPIAIRADGEAALTALLCPPGAPCPECAPTYPDFAASCVSGRCEALRVGVPGG